MPRISDNTNGCRFRIHVTAAIVLFFVTPLVLGGDEPAAVWPLWDGHETVEQYAHRVNLPPTKTLDLGNGVKLETVLIPAGKFIMGTPEREKPAVGQTMAGISAGVLLALVMTLLIRAWKKHNRPQFSLAFMLLMTVVASIGVWGGVRWREALKRVDANDDEHPAHEVTLTNVFYMGKYTVTQEQYQQVMRWNPSQFKGYSNPVETVSWDETQDFCKNLTHQTKQPVRLPTEAEWEYSCRAGTRSTYYSGDTDKDLDRVAWYDSNSKNTTHAVGQKEANGFGLYDMQGNVWQWCLDLYGEDYYGKSPAKDPGGPTQGHGYVMRGSSWGDARVCCRSAYRSWHTPEHRHDYHGFRVVVAPLSRTP